MTTIEKIWYDYLSSEAATLTDEEKEIVKKLMVTEDELVKGLTDTEREHFDLCKNYIYEMTSVNTKQAFMCGVKFTAGFLLEVLGK